MENLLEFGIEDLLVHWDNPYIKTLVLSSGALVFFILSLWIYSIFVQSSNRRAKKLNLHYKPLADIKPRHRFSIMDRHVISTHKRKDAKARAYFEQKYAEALKKTKMEEELERQRKEREDSYQRGFRNPKN